MHPTAHERRRSLCSLPYETIREIVEYLFTVDTPVVNVRTGRMSVLGYYSLLWVCRYLRTVILEHRLAWSKRVFDVPAAIETVVNFSGDSPLHLELTDCVPRGNGAEGWSSPEGMDIIGWVISRLGWVISRPEIVARVVELRLQGGAWTTAQSFMRRRPSGEYPAQLCSGDWSGLKRIIFFDYCLYAPLRNAPLEVYEAYYTVQSACKLDQLAREVLAPCANTLLRIAFITPRANVARPLKDGDHPQITLPYLQSLTMGSISMGHALWLFGIVKLNPCALDRMKLVIEHHQYIPNAVAESLNALDCLRADCDTVRVMVTRQKNPSNFRLQFEAWRRPLVNDGDHLPPPAKAGLPPNFDLTLLFAFGRETPPIPVQEHWEYALALLLRKMACADPDVLFLDMSAGAHPLDGVDWDMLSCTGARFVTPYNQAHSLARRGQVEAFGRDWGEDEDDESDDHWHENAGDDDDSDDVDDYEEAMYTADDMETLRDMSVLYTRPEIKPAQARGVP